MVPDLLWDDVESFFDPNLMGSLPDVSVADASVDGWQAVLDLARSRSWVCEYSEDGAVLRLPRAEVRQAWDAPLELDPAVPELPAGATSDELSGASAQ